MQTASEHHAGRCHFEVERSAFESSQFAMWEDGCHMRFEWRFIIAEPRITIDTEERYLRHCNKLGRKVMEVFRELLDHRDHRPSDVRIIDVPPLAEPLAIVMTPKRSEKRNCLRRKTGQSSHEATFQWLLRPVTVAECIGQHQSVGSGERHTSQKG